MSTHGGDEGESSDDDSNEYIDGDCMSIVAERSALNERRASRRPSIATEQLMELHDLQGASNLSIASLSSNVLKMSIVSTPCIHDWWNGLYVIGAFDKCG